MKPLAETFLSYASILLLIKQCPHVNGVPECHRRQTGACKMLTNYRTLQLSDFSNPQPEGFLLKTSMEVNLEANARNYENRIIKEHARPIGYTIRSYLATVEILYNETQERTNSLYIDLGLKSSRMARLEVEGVNGRTIEFCTFPLILPTFPYRLRLEITAAGKFSVYADGYVEPFFKHQLDPIVGVDRIRFNPRDKDLAAFVDCNSVRKTSSQPNCGSHRVDSLYGCRESFVGTPRRIEVFPDAKYRENVLFDELMVVDAKDLKLEIESEDNILEIAFHHDVIVARLLKDDGNNRNRIKSIRAKVTEVPASPYAVQVMLTNGPDGHFVRISNIRGDLILQMDLCGRFPFADSMWMISLFENAKFYFDCIGCRPDDRSEIDGFAYDEFGYNFTKSLLETRQYVDTSLLYNIFSNDDTGKKIYYLTKDWCDPTPDIFQPKSLTNEQTSKQILSELQTLNNASAVANNAILAELETQNNNSAVAIEAIRSELEILTNAIAVANNASALVNNAILSELQNIRTSLASQSVHNVSTVDSE